MQTKTEATATILGIGLADLNYWIIKYGDEVVDSSNYSIKTSDGPWSFVITFDEEYINGLSGDYSFWAYLAYDSAMVYLRLTVNVPETPSPTPPPTPRPTSTPTTKVPQTGDSSADTFAWAVVFIVSLLGVFAALAWRKYQKAHVSQ